MLLLAVTLCLTSCFETVQEIVIKADGTGSITTTSDMSSLLSIAKMYGAKEMDEVRKESFDTTIQLSSIAENISDLTASEKQLLGKGSLGIRINVEEGVMVNKSYIPFSSISQLGEIGGLSARMLDISLMKALDRKESKNAENEDIPDFSFDKYFVTSYSQSVIERRLNKIKYADLAGDEGMEGLKEMSKMGMSTASTLIYSLPRPVKKAEGKNLKVSDDKRTVTIKGDAEAFFENAADLEFRIEY